jgi:hypothetical protein
MGTPCWVGFGGLAYSTKLKTNTGARLKRNRCDLGGRDLFGA